MRTNFDSPWKRTLECFFKHWIDFLLPDIAKEIDWDQPHQFLDKELLSIQKKTKVGNRIADSLIKVFKKDGEEAWVIVHVEVQGAKEPNFSERMFEYYYRIHDKYKTPLMSLAILTDNNSKWRPNEYRQALWTCNLALQYPIIKLIDFESRKESLEASSNPISKVILAHLTALRCGKDATLKLENKLRLVKDLYSLGYTSEDIKALYLFIDYVLMLPDELEAKFISDIKNFEGEKNMQYITSAERLGREVGLQEGRQEGRQEGERKVLQKMLEHKFGALDHHVLEQLRKTTLDDLERITQDFWTATSIDDLFCEYIPA